jgi:glucokinase
MNAESTPDVKDSPWSPAAAATAAPRLLADIGATYARFCVEEAPGRFEHVVVLPCADFAGFADVVQAYLRGLEGTPPPRHAAIATANPIAGDRVQMTNRDWSFSIEQVRQQLGFATFLVVNNFTALAMALPGLDGTQRVQVGGGEPQGDGVIALLGPGTGLGVSGLIPAGDRWSTLATEGGHVSFAPNDERELRVLQHAWKHLPHVSAERLVSGPGIELIHEALTQGTAQAGQRLTTAEIVRRAVTRADPACAETVDCFCGMLGTVASDLALTLGATGGVYIGGGIVPRLGELFERSSFRTRFESKGRFSAWLAKIPTFVLTADNPTFRGLSLLLAEHVPDTSSPHSPLLDRVRASRDTLTPAERRVADVVLGNPRSLLNDAIAVIAQQAEVSQPTVIRFCRSLGFEGLADFKLKLASGLTGTIPVLRSQVRRGEPTADLSAKVLDNTISAIVHLRESLNAAAIDRAIALLRGARRVEIFACGNSAVVALDAQHKLLRFRIPVVAQTDTSLQGLAAEMLSPGDVAVFISSSGQTAELVRAAGVAIERGASVIAITASQSRLARLATVCLGLDHAEDSSTFLSMVARILQLLVIDIMSVGLAVQRDTSATREPGDGASRTTPAPGVRISHLS